MGRIIRKLGGVFVPIIFCTALIFTAHMSLDLTDDLQGNARVINYIGIVRGATQRLIKKELNHEPDDELIYFLDNILSGLSNGSDELNLIKLDSEEFQTMLIEMQNDWEDIKAQIYNYRKDPSNQMLYELSEDYFRLANDTVFTAEEYTEHTVQNARKSLVITNIIFGLMAFGCSVFTICQEKRRKKLIEAEQDNIKKGILFGIWAWTVKDCGLTWGMDDPQDISAGTYYLLSQAWVWAARAGLDTDGCVDQVKRTIDSLYLPSRPETAETFKSYVDEFMEEKAYDVYTFEMAVYTSGSSTNQDMLTYDFDTFIPIKELKIGIYKQGTITNTNIANAVYGIYSDNACMNKIADITTGIDGRGTATWTGNPGIFYIKETSAPVGTILNQQVYQVYVDGDSVTNVPYVNTTNQEWSASATLTKKDPVSGQNLKGAVFTLQEWNGNQYNNKKTLTDNGDGTYLTGTLYYSPSNQGKYKIVETAAPTGYLNSGWSQEFTISTNDQSFTYEIKNQPWSGSAAVTKKDALSGHNIKGAVFTLQEWNGNQYANKKTLTDNGDGTYSTGTLYYSTSNQGRYKIVETTAPIGYTNSGWNQEFTISANGQNFTYEIKNEQVRGQIDVTKEDRETGDQAQGDASLDGAVYALFAKENIPHPDGSGNVYSKNQEISRKTIQNGTLTFSDLYLGQYYIQEISAPTGYQLDPTQYPVTLSYKDQNTHLIVAQNTVKEDVMKRPIRIVKLSTDGGSGVVSPLSGAEFTIKLKSEVENKGWEAATTYDVISSGDDGWATSNALPYGMYQVRETKVPDGFWKTDDFEVMISENNTDPIQILLNNAPMKAGIKIVKKDSRTGEIIPLAGAQNI